MSDYIRDYHPIIHVNRQHEIETETESRNIMSENGILYPFSTKCRFAEYFW